MARTAITAIEIRDLLQSKTNSIPLLKEDEIYVQIPLPKWCSEDENGCNWTIQSLSCAETYANVINLEILKLQKIYSLKENE